MKAAKWLYFVELDLKGKTRIWAVFSKSSGIALGLIQWHCCWRRYCFLPAQETLFDVVCLRELADFCEEKTSDHWKTKIEELAIANQ
jgi:hypothetical protein